VEGIGEAAFLAASFAIIAIEFPETLATTFVRIELDPIFFYNCKLHKIALKSDPNRISEIEILL
jgi:hypothetical protein